MNTTIHKNTTIQNFTSIQEITQHIAKTPRNPQFRGEQQSETASAYWTGTKSLTEALELMTTGYDIDIEPITPHSPTAPRQTPTPAPYGAYASVPRYLTGQPNSMIAYKTTPVKTRVVSLYKDIAFSVDYSAKDILKFGKTAVQIVQALEAAGVRTNLYVYCCVSNYPTTIGFTVPIKKASERLSLRKMTFAVAHPSMLRRIFLALVERFPTDTDFSGGYGSPDPKKYILGKDCYNIPNQVIDVATFVKTVLK